MRFLSLAFLLLFAGFMTAYSQSPPDVISRAQKISLLRSSRSEVRDLFWDYDQDILDTSGGSDTFSKDDVSVTVYYSSGGCSEYDDIWDIHEGVAIKIEVSTEEPQPAKAFGLSMSTLEKERAYSDAPKSLVFFSKDKSLAIEMDDEKVQKIILLPSKTTKHHLCDTDAAARFSAKNWFGDSKLTDRRRSNEDLAPAILSVELNSTVLPVFASNKDVRVAVSASYHDDDVITYIYNVSGGKIIGKGPNVTWRLDGLPRGTYTITVGVDDGCGVCGKTNTQTVTIN